MWKTYLELDHIPIAEASWSTYRSRNLKLTLEILHMFAVLEQEKESGPNNVFFPSEEVIFVKVRIYVV